MASDDEDVRLLEHSLAELSIQNAVRKIERKPLRDELLVVKFNILAKDVMRTFGNSYDTFRREIIIFFGAPTIIIAKGWELILANSNNGDKKIIQKKEHLLWTLHYMKQESPNITVLCKTMKTESKKSTLKKTVLK